MSTDLSRPSVTAPPRRSGARVVVGLLGLAVVVLGVVLLANPVAAARSLALLVGLSFVAGGLLEIAVGWDSGRSRGASVLLGAVLVVGGVLAAVWPGVTLWTLVLVTALSLLVHGAGRIALAVVGRDRVDGRGWLAALGVVDVVVGVLALTWPEATVLVLCVLFGVQVLFLGLALVAVAFLRPAGGAAVGR
ncbi:HdeD family acid-resistance protein [Geodermatophilus sp. SYSU D01062]